MEVRIRSGTELDSRGRTNMPRSRSEKSLKNTEQGTEDKLTILSQMFWIAVSLLESDYEYEFLLATRLLDKVWLKEFLYQACTVKFINFSDARKL